MIVRVMFYSKKEFNTKRDIQREKVVNAKSFNSYLSKLPDAETTTKRSVNLLSTAQLLTKWLMATKWPWFNIIRYCWFFFIMSFFHKSILLILFH